MKSLSATPFADRRNQKAHRTCVLIQCRYVLAEAIRRISNEDRFHTCSSVIEPGSETRCGGFCLCTRFCMTYALLHLPFGYDPDDALMDEGIGV
ncbi:hypothetical protein KCP76_21675 [Salmonella enterica subsp. enterica serovar Weltevreden]|nr:hypothetical protein KCP76_21675 [Salmonella enterica subsp. enterica serovar Weltevreden]